MVKAVVLHSPRVRIYPENTNAYVNVDFKGKSVQVGYNFLQIALSTFRLNRTLVVVIGITLLDYCTYLLFSVNL